MCTQSRSVRYKGRTSDMMNGRGSDSTNSTRHACNNGRSQLLKKSACYKSKNTETVIQVNCFLAKPSIPSVIKCKHMLCLLLAYFAVAGATEAANGEHVAPPRLQENVTNVQNTLVLDEKNGHRPSPTSKSPTAGPKTMDDSLNGRDQSQRRNIPGEVLEHEELKTSDDENDYTAKEKSKYFTSKLFQRYGNDSFLLKEDLEELFINIGLMPTLNNSKNNLQDIKSEKHDDHHHSHMHGHEHNDHSAHSPHDPAGPETESDALHKTSNRGLHGPSNATAPRLKIDHALEDLQQKHSSHANARNNSSNVHQDTSPQQRQKRNVKNSHRHEEHNKCLSALELLIIFKYDNLQNLTLNNFRYLCPALIDQLDAGYCKQDVTASGHRSDQHSHSHGRDDHEGHQHEDDHIHRHDQVDEHSHEHDHEHEKKSEDVHDHGKVEAASFKGWCYALASVAVISLCSVAGVVVIPNMKRVFYNHVLQFLVALAVGAMSGDAMLHLLPHAMLSDHDHGHHHHEAEVNETDIHHGHGHDEEGTEGHSAHTTALYKGLVALLGIYSFFFLERLFTLFTRNRSGRSKRKQKRRRRCLGGDEQRSQAFHMVNSNLENDRGNTPSCDEMVMVVHPNKALRAYADVSHEAYLHHCDESLAQSSSGHGETVDPPRRDHHFVREDSFTLEGITNTGAAAWSASQGHTVKSDAEIVGVTKDADPAQNSHTHSHSHSHLAPDFVGSLSSVAMMVVVGDMVHNFCDGLAIGAAFAGSVAGGLSTSVAVFCHELPHEIGDFAVLVRSGLSMKKAVYFNLITSIPCFIGAFIGLAVGNVASTSSWIFAGVGGMFFYITLVDLVPEMSSVYTKCGEPWFLHLLLQASGIAVGTTIMLIISVSEESLLTVFV